MEVEVLVLLVEMEVEVDVLLDVLEVEVVVTPPGGAEKPIVAKPVAI